MKALIPNYTFNTTTKQVTFTDFSNASLSIELDRIYLIADTSKNVIIYNFADASLATATTSGATVTLSTLPSGLSNSDQLMIIYEAKPTDPLLPAVFTTRISQATATLTYFGEAAVGTAESSAGWRIGKIDTSSGLKTLYANGGNFTEIWTNRASISVWG